MRKEITEQESWDFWKPIVMPKGQLVLEQVKKELHDYYVCLEEVPRVYCHITGNHLSKPLYHAETVIAKYNEEIQKAYDEGYDDAQEEKRQ